MSGMIIALVLVLAAVPLIARLARAADFVDRPGGRKQHGEAVPPVGGLAVFPVFMTVTALAGLPSGYFWFFAALALLLVMGALDDAFTIPAKFKFIVQICAAVMAVAGGGAHVTSLGNLLGFGSIWLGWGGIVFSVTAAVLLINAVNLMDGLDGLAGGTGFAALTVLAVAAVIKGGGFADLPPLLILIGALAGFLVYNMRHPWRKRASVFLGDSGSLALGLALAWFCIRLSQLPGPYALRPVAVAWILTLPIYDTCGQFARRVAGGRHPFDADHHHFHHHFLFAGFSPGRATAFILLLSFLAGMIGIGGLLIGVPEYVLGWLWTVLLLAHIYMSLRPHRFRRLLVRLSGVKNAAPT